MAKQARLRFMQDGSRHWYAIPAEKREAFSKRAESFTDDNPRGDPDVGFDEYRLGMHVCNYSFADLQGG